MQTLSAIIRRVVAKLLPKPTTRAEILSDLIEKDNLIHGRAPLPNGVPSSLIMASMRPSGHCTRVVKLCAAIHSGKLTLELGCAPWTQRRNEEKVQNYLARH